MEFGKNKSNNHIEIIAFVVETRGVEPLTS